MSEFKVMTDWRKVSPRLFYEVYESVHFGMGPGTDFPDDYMERIFGPGKFGFFVYEETDLVGAARVFSDDAYCTWIAEICVRPDRQGEGIGRLILGQINKRFRHTALYADAFKEQVEFFQKQKIKPKAKLVACSRAPCA